METSLRITLVIVALVIVAGIVWDAFWSRGKKPWKNSKKVSQDKTRLAAQNWAEKPSEENREDLELLAQDEALEEFNSKQFRAEHSREGYYKNNPFSHWENEEEEDDLSSHDVILQKKIPKNKERDYYKEAYDREYQKEMAKKNKNPQKSETSNATAHTSFSSVGLQDLMVLNVMARQPGVFQARKLLDALNEAYMIYGEMDIFHRHENIDGSGQVVFSLASAVEPGTFTISKIDNFVTPGVILFFQMQRPNQAIAAFELMLRTAKQLAMRLDGEIKDQNHKFLTLGMIEKYRDRARHYFKSMA